MTCSSSADRRAVERRCKISNVSSVSTIPAWALKSLLLKTGGRLRTEMFGPDSRKVGIMDIF